MSGRRRSLPFQGYFRGADGSCHARGDRGERADARDSLRRTGDLRGFGHGDAGGRVGVDSRLCAGAGGARGVFRHFERRRRDAQRELLGRDHAGRLPPADPHHHLCRSYGLRKSADGADHQRAAGNPLSFGFGAHGVQYGFPGPDADAERFARRGRVGHQTGDPGRRLRDDRQDPDRPCNGSHFGRCRQRTAPRCLLYARSDGDEQFRFGRFRRRLYADRDRIHRPDRARNLLLRSRRSGRRYEFHGSEGRRFCRRRGELLAGRRARGAGRPAYSR